jgi:hypothetical protein
MLFFNNPEILNNEQLSLLKLKTQGKLPDYLVEFFTKNSNATPNCNGKSCVYKIIHPDGYIQIASIEKIVGLEGVFAEFEDRDTLFLYVKEQELTTDFVEIEHLCPFAYAPNGVFYISVSGKHDGKVYFADNGDFGILFLTNSFENFWDSVYGDTNDHLKLS